MCNFFLIQFNKNIYIKVSLSVGVTRELKVFAGLPSTDPLKNEYRLKTNAKN